MANISRNASARRSRPTFQLTNVLDIPVKVYAVTIVKGRPVKSVILDTTIEGNVQPLKFQELMLMEEGDRTREWVKVYTTSPITTLIEPYEDSNPDSYIIWEGNSYRVMKEKHYVMGILDHYCVYCAREPLDAGEG